MEHEDKKSLREKLFLPNGLFRISDAESLIEKGIIPFVVENLNLPWEDALEFGEPVTFSPGETLYSTYESGRYFYYLKKGSLQSWYVDELGNPVLHLFMRSGVLFNEMICFSGIHKNDFMIFVEKSSAYRFDRTTLFTREFCSRFSSLLLNAACSIARKGLILSEFRNAFANMDIINDVARILYTISSSCERIEITQDLMAKILRVDRSSITRIIKRLKEMGVIAKATKKEVEIKDMEALKRLAFGHHR